MSNRGRGLTGLNECAEGLSQAGAELSGVTAYLRKSKVAPPPHPDLPKSENLIGLN